MRLLWILLVGSLFLPCWATEKEETPLKELKVVLSYDFPPFYHRTPDGEFQGASFEIAAHVCEQLGFKLAVTQVDNMSSLLADLGSGRQNLAINLTSTPERDAIALFTSVPHLYETQNLIVRANSDINYSGQLRNLVDYRFGPIFGWTYGPTFDNARHLNKVYVNDSVEQLRRLLSGRYDIAINNPEFFMNLAEKADAENAFKVLHPEVYTLPVTMAVSRQHPNAESLIGALNKGISEFKQTKHYQRILEKYGFSPGGIEMRAE